MGKKIAFWTAEGLLLLLGIYLKFIMLPLSFLGLVCLFLAALLGCYGLLAILIPKYGRPARIARWVLSICVCVGLLAFCVTEAFVIRASIGDPDRSCKYMVVLGCMVRPNGPSTSLQNRINTAYDYLTAHPEVIAVVSGGQGDDEPMPEALCMYEELVAMGIEPERIWMEDRSKSTWTNLQYSLAIIEERTGSRPDTIGILSSEYHLLRASLLAKDQGVDTVGIPAASTSFTEALNHFMREVAGIWHYTLLGGQYD